MKKVLIGISLGMIVVVPFAAFAQNNSFFDAPYLNIYSYANEVVNDSDLDGLVDGKDPCPQSAFSIFVLNKSTKKKPGVIRFADPAGRWSNNYDSLNPPGRYLRLQSINKKAGTIKVQTSPVENFNPPPVSDPYLEASKMVQSYTLNFEEPFEMHEINKKLKVLYANAAKGYVVIAFIDSGGIQEGCAPSALPEELKPL